MTDKKSFWATLPGILTGVAAVISAVVSFLVVIGKFSDPSGVDVIIDTSVKSSIIISEINAKSPDYVILKNASQKNINVKGYELSEGSKAYKISDRNNSTNIAPNKTLRVFFIKPYNKNIGNDSDIISTAFKISSGELIKLRDSAGNKIYQLRAE